MTPLRHRFVLWFLSKQDPRWWIWWSRLSRTMRRSASDSQHDVLKDEVGKCPSLRWFSVCRRKGPWKASLDGILQKQKEQAKQLSVRITDAFRIPDGKQVKCHCRPFNVRPFNGIPGNKRRRTERTSDVKSTVQLMDQLVLFRARGLDCLSLDGSYAPLHPSSDGLSARAHGKKRGLLGGKLKRGDFRLILEKLLSKHRLLQKKDGACLRLIRSVCAHRSRWMVRGCL